MGQCDDKGGSRQKAVGGEGKRKRKKILMRK